MNDSKIVISKSELFRHPQFGNLRVLTDEKGDPWFVGKVVAEALGYKIPQKAISDHVLSSDRKVLKYKAFSEMEKAKIWQGNDFSDKSLINESGVYSLILGSQLPSAIEFKHWVTSEVLPQIRKTGGYEQKNEVEKQLRSDLEIMSLAYGIKRQINVRLEINY